MEFCDTGEKQVYSVIESNPDTLTELLDQMIADIDTFLKVSAISDSTLEIYGHYLVMFALWTREKNIKPQDVEPINIISFLGDHAQWSHSTRHNATAAIRQFYRWKYGEDHPATQTHIRKVLPPPQRSLNRDELEGLLDSINTSKVVGKRDKAIVCLMADTGMRASEIVNLEIKNVDLKAGSLVTLAKGSLWIDKVFTPYTANTIQDWLDVRNQATTDTKYLFVSVGGKRSGTRLTRWGLFRLFQRLATRADLDDFSPHAMRRTFATLAIENGAPTRLVQVAGGWSTLQMVERYTRNLKPEKMAGYSPLRQYIQKENGKTDEG